MSPSRSADRESFEHACMCAAWDSGAWALGGWMKWLSMDDGSVAQDCACALRFSGTRGRWFCRVAYLGWAPPAGGWCPPQVVTDWVGLLVRTVHSESTRTPRRHRAREWKSGRAKRCAAIVVPTSGVPVDCALVASVTCVRVYIHKLSTVENKIGTYFLGCEQDLISS